MLRILRNVGKRAKTLTLLVVQLIKPLLIKATINATFLLEGW